MSYIIVGLGNPGEEYNWTRHNTGRLVCDFIAKENDCDEFTLDKKINALKAKGKIGKQNVTFVEPETFMNNSGKAVAPVVKSVKAAEKLIVVYDDFNLPLGSMRISYNRSSGGHNGLESIIKSIKTEAFIRIRIGIAPENSKGDAKVPHGDEKIEKFILGKYKDEEITLLKKVMKRANEAVRVIVDESKEKAMSLFNGQN